jgi:hypothetical protein
VVERCVVDENTSGTDGDEANTEEAGEALEGVADGRTDDPGRPVPSANAGADA